mgnify:CR=1 FL=1
MMAGDAPNNNVYQMTIFMDDDITPSVASRDDPPEREGVVFTVVKQGEGGRK